MERIMSWRWSRLLDHDAIRRIDTREVKFSLAVYVIIFCFATFILHWHQTAFYLTIFYIFYILGNICTSDAFFNIKDPATKRYIKLYVYESFKPKFRYNLYIKDQKDISALIFDDFEWITRSNKAGWFIFLNNNKWYYQCGTKTILLGERIGRIMFIEKCDNQKIKLKLLSSDELKELTVDSIFYGKNIFIPELRDFDQENTDYALIKTDDKYKLLSTSYIYCGDKGMLFFSYERYKTVVFCEDKETIVVAWDDKNKEHKVIYKNINMIDDLQTIVEADNNQLPGKGRIYKFATKHKTLNVVYNGEIRKIDKEHRLIICEEGSTSYSY